MNSFMAYNPRKLIPKIVDDISLSIRHFQKADIDMSGLKWFNSVGQNQVLNPLSEALGSGLGDLTFGSDDTGSVGFSGYIRVWLSLSTVDNDSVSFIYSGGRPGDCFLFPSSAIFRNLPLLWVSSTLPGLAPCYGSAFDFHAYSSEWVHGSSVWIEKRNGTAIRSV